VTYWADEVAASVEGPQVVNDSKTPSGTIHVGSLRGVVLHDVLWRAVRERGLDVTFRYGVEDLDPMDAQSLLTPDAVERFMGVPLSRVPAPADSPLPNYARHFASLFLETFAGLGIHPELYWMSELYESGRMDEFVVRALDRASEILEIYATVSTVKHSADWLPVEVICESCGRIGTTHATDWNGRDVAYDCLADKVEWAKGCGYHGRISPLGGRGKLVWNVEWAARWSLFGVTIEGCGKDLATAGGSRDRADAISRRVFEREPPINVPYEFLNIGGKKMSTSKGEGAAAHRMADVLPAELLRFLFVRHRPNRALEFDPGGDTVPRLFDECDRVAAAVAGKPAKGELPPDPERIFAMSLVDPNADPKAEAAHFRPPFAHMALLLQVPNVDIDRLLAAEKGGVLDDAERRVLEERIRVARIWLEEFASDRYRVAVRHDELPEDTADLREDQRDYLAAVASAAAQAEPNTGEGWQQLLYEIAQARELSTADAFSAVYRAFLGRPNGPRAGWLLASLSLEFAISRLRDAALAPPEVAAGPAGKDL
jgi:lysyl-tRNA synthetase class 1